MQEHKHEGFTIVELIVVIIVIALLATITTIAYRSTQLAAKDENRKADALMLQSAIDEYYSMNGSYPSPSCPADPGDWDTECWRNQAWEILKTEGLIRSVPSPDMKSTISSENVNPDGTTNYVWFRHSNSSYAIYVPFEGRQGCKIHKGSPAWTFTSAPVCDF